MTTSEKLTCPKCNGKNMIDDLDGDKTCLNCGHIIYLLKPLPVETRVINMPGPKKKK